MNKIKLLIFVLAAISASCNKIEVSQAEPAACSDDCGMIISVDGQNTLEPQTKAVKTAWENGDKIYLFTEDTGTGYFTLTYNKSHGKWTAAKSGTIDESFITSGTGASTDKKVLAFHVPFGSVTPTCSSGTWTIPTGDVYYTYDNNVQITHINTKGHYVKVQISLKAPTNFVQIYVDRDRVNQFTTGTTSAGSSKMSCNNLVKLSNVKITGDSFSVTTSPQAMTGRRLTGASGSGTVFYGIVKSSQNATTTFTMNSGAVEYTYSKSATLAEKAYDMSHSSWTALLPGHYAISATQYARFTPANLEIKYVNSTTNEWRFHLDQFDVVGNQNISQKSSGGWYDLFGWGATGKARSGRTATSPWEYTTNSSSSQYATQEAKFRSDLNTQADKALNADDDWSANVIEYAKAKTYITLSAAEWTYLLQHNTYRLGTVNGIKGLILAPGTGKTINPSYTLNNWRTVERDNGYVFLPAAGYRNGATSTYENSYSEPNFFYWTRSIGANVGTNNDTGTYKCPFGLAYYSNSLIPDQINWRRTGRAVRLVKEFNN